MLFCINTIHSGFAAGFLAFVIFWYGPAPIHHLVRMFIADRYNSLPGAVGMYSLSVGIARVGNTLPDPVYALLSGLNAATVGIIALAAVRLSEKAITDKLTRLLVYLGGVMGMLYTAWWYYPTMMVGAGLTTVLWDLRYLHAVLGLFRRARRKKNEKEKVFTDLDKGTLFNDSQSSQGLWKPLPPPPPAYSKQDISSIGNIHRQSPISWQQPISKRGSEIPVPEFCSMTWKVGASIILIFLITFILTLVLNSLTRSPTRPFSLFSSLYLAGTIIFGGGPVVIPLLREYIVTPGWVSPRDFLLGLAIIQAFQAQTSIS